MLYLILLNIVSPLLRYFAEEFHICANCLRVVATHLPTLASVTYLAVQGEHDESQSLRPVRRPLIRHPTAQLVLYGAVGAFY